MGIFSSLIFIIFTLVIYWLRPRLPLGIFLLTAVYATTCNHHGMDDGVQEGRDHQRHLQVRTIRFRCTKTRRREVPICTKHLFWPLPRWLGDSPGPPPALGCPCRLLWIVAVASRQWPANRYLSCILANCADNCPARAGQNGRAHPSAIWCYV